MKRIRPTYIVATVAVIAGIYLLFSPRSRDGWAERRPPDLWYRGVSAEFITSAEAKELAAAEFAVVSANEAEALARLERAAAVEVSPQEAEAYAGRPLAGTGGRLILLRALSWDTPYGGFTVSWRAGAVRISHGCLSDRSLPVVRRAIVARLPDLPSEVYVDLSMAE